MSEAAASELQPSASVICTPVGNFTYLAVKAALFDDENLEALRQASFECMDQGRFRLAIDLSTVQQASSRAFELFAELQDNLASMGGWLKLARMNPVLRQAAEIAGLTDFIGILDEQGDGTTTPPQASGGRLGDRLVAEGLLTAAQVEEAVRLQTATGRRLGEIVVDREWVTEAEVLDALGKQLGLRVASLKVGLYDPEVVKSLDRTVAQRLKVVPLFRVRGEVTLATTDPQSAPRIQEVEDRLSCSVRLVLSRRQDITRVLEEAHEDSSLTDELIGDLDEDLELLDDAVPKDFSVIDEMAAGSPVINTVNAIIQRAVRERASDIHIEPARGRSRVRFRIDGVLYEVMKPRAELHPALVSRLKVMANLDIAEHRLPQDGRIQVQTQGRVIDLRFSSLPGIHGEKVVLRVLDKSQTILDVNKLGMSHVTADTFRDLLGRSHGLILVTGPTGSGKTTSLYAAMNHLNSTEKNIVTIEDPVEYQLEIVNQNEVKPAIGLDFARVLKHVLRQDPDVVMVGEIRERETARIAVQAALTGHLVLSTLHTNDSVGAISRMIDMGVEPYLLASSLVGVVAQRLLRTVCSHCRTVYVAPPEVTQAYGWDDSRIRLARGRGCEQCFDSGYKGRTAIHEILVSDRELQHLILKNPSRDELSQFFESRGYASLFSEGIERVRQGLTTPEEVERVVNLG